MFEEDMFIGEFTNTSGMYAETTIEELKERLGGNLPRIYKFTPIYAGDHGRGYYITDPVVVEAIRQLDAQLFIATDNLDGDLAGTISKSLQELLYELVVKKEGLMSLIVGYSYYMQQEKNKSFVEGKRAVQKELQRVLGLPNDLGGVRR